MRKIDLKYTTTKLPLGVIGAWPMPKVECLDFCNSPPYEGHRSAQAAMQSPQEWQKFAEYAEAPNLKIMRVPPGCLPDEKAIHLLAEATGRLPKLEMIEEYNGNIIDLSQYPARKKFVRDQQVVGSLLGKRREFLAMPEEARETLIDKVAAAEHNGGIPSPVANYVEKVWEQRLSNERINNPGSDSSHHAKDSRGKPVPAKRFPGGGWNPLNWVGENRGNPEMPDGYSR